MNRRFTRYAQFGMLLALVMTGSLFGQSGSAPQSAPATKFGLPAAKPATTTVATPPAAATMTAGALTNQSLSAKAAAGPIVGGNTSPLSVSAATVVLTQQGVTSSTSFRCSKFIFSAVNTLSLSGPTTVVGAGKATWNASFAKPWDAAPDPFLAALMEGGHFDSVSFTFVSPTGQPVYTVALKTVFIKSIDKGFDASTGAALEEISLIFGAFKMQDAAGNPTIYPTTAKGSSPGTAQDSWLAVQ